MNWLPTYLEEIASRATSLYSRPTVAIQLTRLASDPDADAEALKECVARDPALVCKILRVVNSSLFGLNRPVADVNQAIGLLGIKPLKLLLLGFSLPDELFAGRAARELEWYWTNTLTRAVAARMLAEQIWREPGDEAFTAGMLQDIGMLVLLRELGEPYARFLSGAIQERCNLAALEHDTIGFDHMQLSGALLRRWRLPPRLVEAIGMPKWTARLARLDPPEGDLPQILHMAELLVQLVCQQRLDVLRELLDGGRVYRGMTRPQLAALVKELQPQVDQLAQTLSLELCGERNYARILLDAHLRMAALSEEIARGGERDKSENAGYEQLLSHSLELTGALRRWVEGPLATEAPGPCRAMGRGEQAHSSSLLLEMLSAAAMHCRDRRQELSLLLLEPNVEAYDPQPEAGETARYARRALTALCDRIGREEVTLIELANGRTAAIIADCERLAAIHLAHQVLAEHEKLQESLVETDVRVANALSIGVATASAVPKNFDAVRMIECAARCLSAARACSVSAVKSIEV